MKQLSIDENSIKSVEIAYEDSKAFCDPETNITFFDNQTHKKESIQ